MVAILVLLLVVAVSLWFASPDTLCYAQGGYGVGASSGGASGLPPQYTFIGEKLDQQGLLTRDTTAKSYDELCQLTLNAGTKALSRTGDSLSSILMVESRASLTPPSNAEFTGLVYDLRPDGATFDPPITLTITYELDDIPEGVGEENLVIANWDGTNWINLEGPFTRDLENNTISAPISHFTEFTIIAYTQPAVFTTSSLTPSPAVIETGQDMTISVTVTNTGDLASSYELTLEIDNKVIATEEITLAGHASEKVNFPIIADYAPGSYMININGLSGILTITEAAPTPPAPASTPAPPVTLPAPPVTPPAPPVTPVTPPAPPTVPSPAPPVTPINWWLIGGIIVAVILITVVVWLRVARHRV